MPYTFKVQSRNPATGMVVEQRFVEGGFDEAFNELGQVAGMMKKGEIVDLINMAGETVVSLECVVATAIEIR